MALIIHLCPPANMHQQKACALLEGLEHGLGKDAYVRFTLLHIHLIHAHAKHSYVSRSQKHNAAGKANDKDKDATNKDKRSEIVTRPERGSYKPNVSGTASVAIEHIAEEAERVANVIAG